MRGEFDETLFFTQTFCLGGTQGKILIIAGLTGSLLDCGTAREVWTPTPPAMPALRSTSRDHATPTDRVALRQASLA
jgi:hypothetical protein